MMDAFKSSSTNQKKLLSDLIILGNDLKNQVVFTKNNKWKDYCSIITLNTYATYGPQVIYDIVNSSQNTDVNSFSLDNFSENKNIINEIKKIVLDNIDALKYHDETLELFSRSYKN